MVDLFGRIVPFKLTVVVCETPPGPSNLMTPTSATGPTGPKATIEPLVAIPKEPFNVLTEHSSESALADGASDKASASVKTIVNGLLIFFITVHLTLGFRTLQQLGPWRCQWRSETGNRRQTMSMWISCCLLVSAGSRGAC